VTSKIIAIAVAVVILLVLLHYARMAWRFRRGDVEMEAGGSDGRQLFGRRRNKERDPG
jgi:hypothetical protein